MIQPIIHSLVLGLLFGAAYGQPATFDTLYTQGHIGYAIMPGSQGYTIAGNHHNGDLWLFGVNGQGMIQWEETYGRHYGLFDAASLYDAAATLDGYFLAGRSYSIPDTNWGGKTFGYVVKTDPEGHQLWDRMFYTTYDSSRSSTFYNVTPTPDGGCLLSGEAIVNPDVTILSDTRFWVVKLDSLGNVEFDRLYKNSDPGYTYDTGHNEAIAYSDGFLIGTSYNHGRKGYLMRLDLNGDTLWTRKYDRLPGDEQRRLVMIEDMVELADGGYLLAARSFLIRTDSLGNLLWRQPDILANRLAWLPDGNLIAHIGGVLQKITPDGQILWQRDYTSYDLDPVDFIRFSAVSHAHDGGLMVLYDNLSGLGLMKTDCEGNLVNPVPCAATSLASRPSAELVKVYPNPSSGPFTIDLDPKHSYRLTITDMAGRTLLHQTTQNQSQYQWDAEAYPDTINMLSNKNENTGKIQYLKMVKQRVE